MRYSIPIMSGRGFSSLAPRHAIYKRYEQSGKEKLVLLFVTDFDPDGEQIAHSFARSMRDDFEIQGDKIHAHKVALTIQQIQDFDLPPGNPAKGPSETTRGSSNYPAFVAAYGDDARDDQGIVRTWELEALPAETLQQILADAIDSVIDTEAFNDEVDADRADCGFLDQVRGEVHEALADLDLDNGAAT